MRDIEVRVRIAGDKVQWKMHAIPNDSNMSPEEFEKVSNALDTVRISILSRKNKKFGTTSVEKILSQVDISNLENKQ